MDVMAFWVSEHVAHKVTAHTHDFYQLIYCKTGGGRITIDQQEYAARPGHVYLAKPGILHAIENDQQMYLLELKFIAEGAASAELKILPDHFDISELPLAQELLFSVIREGLLQASHYSDAANAALKIFLIHSLRKHALQPIETTHSHLHSNILDIQGHANAHSDVRILNLKYYIANHLQEKITLDELAQEVNFNKTFFVKKFQQLFEMPPMKYVNFMRISRAKQLLLQTSLPITTIASRTGFQSLHYFSRSFRSSEGVSPQEFRKTFGK